MNRRNFIATAALVAAGTTITPSAWAAHDGKVGALTRAEWIKLNRETGDKVKVLKAGADSMSKEDKALLIEIATAGATQLELSKAAAVQAISPDIKAFAQGEVDEQTILAAKLKQIATARGVTLPSMPDDNIRKMVDKLYKKSGDEFDATYLQEVGVTGHETLAKTMTKVQAQAADATLKDLAAIALPLINAHLQAAKDEMNDKD